MKIAYVAQYYFAASTQNMVYGLNKRKHDIFLFVPFPNNIDSLEPGSKILEVNHIKKGKIKKVFPSFPKPLHVILPYPLILLNLISLIQKEKIDIIVCQYHPYHLASFTSYIFSKLFNIPLLIRADDIVFSFENLRTLDKVFYLLVFLLNGYALHNCDKLLVPSMFLKKFVEFQYGISGNKIQVHPNGVNLDIFQSNYDKDTLRNQLKIKHSSVITYLGSFQNRGLETLIDSVPNVIIEKPNTVFYMIGNGRLKKFTEYLKSKSSINKQNIIFTGWVDKSSVVKYLFASDIAIGPLYSSELTMGSFPKKIGEYMACGLPIIAAKGGQSNEVLTHYLNGLLIEPGDHKSLADAILTLLNNRSLLTKFGENGKSKMLSKYSLKHMIDLLENCLIKIVDEKHDIFRG